MTRRERLLLVALVVAAAILVMAEMRRPPASVARPATATPAAPAEQVAPPAAVDPATIRDVFRFAEPKAEPALRATPRPPAASPTVSPAPDGPRLVGLVRRSGRLLAAFSLAGEVMLAGKGGTAFGVTVVDVSEEAVRIRRKDGSEERLRVP